MEQIIVVCGHYGTGKTNFALNLARQKTAQGKQVTLVDLDVVNPYFCTNAYTQQMQREGIAVIQSAMAGSTLDVPALNAGIARVFDETDGVAILDVGGDDVGAKVLGRLREQLTRHGYEMLYVINAFRSQIAAPQDANALLREIEQTARLKATGIVNNSHLSAETTAQDIRQGEQYAKEVAACIGLPLVCTTVHKTLLPELKGEVASIFPVDVIVTLPWN